MIESPIEILKCDEHKVSVKIVFDLSKFETLLRRCESEDYEDLVNEVFYINGFLFYATTKKLVYRQSFKGSTKIPSRLDIESYALQAIEKMIKILDILENKDTKVTFMVK
jgi:hypothetical protein